VDIRTRASVDVTVSGLATAWASLRKNRTRCCPGFGPAWQQVIGPRERAPQDSTIHYRVLSVAMRSRASVSVPGTVVSPRFWFMACLGTFT